ncbi:unnamed protein product [Schistosoma curassoni]|uniref:Uncharacterized protein n=1 Tax=Schistosoma curassoni TaxID=6186 RepID=A0A183JYA0_9TREM|nr:unnamed protein product [Schistosoma curassoni]
MHQNVLIQNLKHPIFYQNFIILRNLLNRVIVLN